MNFTSKCQSAGQKSHEEKNASDQNKQINLSKRTLLTINMPNHSYASINFAFLKHYIPCILMVGKIGITCTNTDANYGQCHCNYLRNAKICHEKSND